MTLFHTMMVGNLFFVSFSSPEEAELASGSSSLVEGEDIPSAILGVILDLMEPSSLTRSVFNAD